MAMLNNQRVANKIMGILGLIMDKRDATANDL